MLYKGFVIHKELRRDHLFPLVARCPRTVRIGVAAQ